MVINLLACDTVLVELVNFNTQQYGRGKKTEDLA